MVKVSVPSLTDARGAGDRALRGTSCAAELKTTEALAAAVAVAAALTDQQMWLCRWTRQEVGRAIVDGLDDVGPATGPRRQGVGRRRRSGRDIDRDRRADHGACQ